jgi:hypothetical protein
VLLFSSDGYDYLIVSLSSLTNNAIYCNNFGQEVLYMYMSHENISGFEPVLTPAEVDLSASIAERFGSIEEMRCLHRKLRFRVTEDKVKDYLDGLDSGEVLVREIELDPIIRQNDFVEHRFQYKGVEVECFYLFEAIPQSDMRASDIRITSAKYFVELVLPSHVVFIVVSSLGVYQAFDRRTAVDHDGTSDPLGESICKLLSDAVSTLEIIPLEDAA